MSFPSQPGGQPGRYPGWDSAPSGPQGPGWQAPPQPDPRMGAPYGYQPPAPQRRGPWAWLIPLLVVLVLAILVAAAGAMGWFGGRSGENADGGVVTVTATEEAPVAEAQTAGEPAVAGRPAPAPAPVTDAQRPTSPALPAGAVAANQAARNGAPAGDFNNVYRGTDVTSEPFAVAVRNDFVSSYLANGSLNQTIYTYSPVTGQRYEMNCSDSGSYVTCRGGNNAVVYIS